MILVAEDNDVLRYSLNKQLLLLGHVGTHARNGNEAVEQAKDRECRLILMDVDMPQLDGLDATRKIRAAEQANGHGRVPIVIVSGITSKKDCLEAGADDFFEKPVHLEQLRAILDQWAPHAGQDQPAFGETLSQTLERRSREKGMNLEVLASLSNLTSDELQQIRDGSETLSVITLMKVAVVLNTDVSDLLAEALSSRQAPAKNNVRQLWRLAEP